MYLDPEIDRAALMSAHHEHDRRYGWRPEWPKIYLGLDWRAGYEPAAPDASSAETIWEWHRGREEAR